MARIGGAGHPDLLSGPRRRSPPRGPVFVALASAALVAGCAHYADALDDVVAVPVHVSREGTDIIVAADLWAAPETRIFVCPEAPVEARDDLFAAGVLSLAESCHDYGSVATEAGRLDARLSVAFTGDEHATFDAAPEWWLVLVGIRSTGAGVTYTTSIPGGSGG